MGSQIHSEPLRCRDCNSEKIYEALDYGQDYLICQDCGVIFMEDNDDENEIIASISKCMHCESVDAIVIYGGEECCNICGLDPSKEDYPASEIAHLWKRRSIEHEDDDKLIREVMLSGPGKFRFDSNIGGFLRSSCGPHCTFQQVCPQTTKIFSRCYREDKLTEDFDVSRRRRKGKNRKGKAQRKAEKEIYRKLNSRSWLFASQKGWYIGNYVTETYNREQSNPRGN